MLDAVGCERASLLVCGCCMARLTSVTAVDTARLSFCLHFRYLILGHFAAILIYPLEYLPDIFVVLFWMLLNVSQCTVADSHLVAELWECTSCGHQVSSGRLVVVLDFVDLHVGGIVCLFVIVYN